MSVVERVLLNKIGKGNISWYCSMCVCHDSNVVKNFMLSPALFKIMF